MYQNPSQHQITFNSPYEHAGRATRWFDLLSCILSYHWTRLPLDGSARVACLLDSRHQIGIRRVGLACFEKGLMDLRPIFFFRLQISSLYSSLGSRLAARCRKSDGYQDLNQIKLKVNWELNYWFWFEIKTNWWCISSNLI